MDYITQHLPALLAGASAVIAAFFAGIWTNRLTMNREAENRRREFRIEIRNIWSRLDSKANGVLLSEYRKSIPEVVRQCNVAQEDIMPWKRGRFQRARSKYCGFTDEQIDPMKRAEFIRMTSDERGNAWDWSRNLLKSTLLDIEKCG
jgi:hypothetical protein